MKAFVHGKVRQVRRVRDPAGLHAVGGSFGTMEVGLLVFL
jgi:hypothetical protein